MRPTSEFIEELKALDPRITVIPNPNYPALVNVKILGQDVTPMPADRISDEPNPDHKMFFGDRESRHRSRAEVLSQVQNTLRFIDASSENLADFTEKL